MNIAITGANGLVGRAVTKLLLQEGHQITAIKRKDSDLTLLGSAANAVNWHESDVLDSLGIYKALLGADAVIHCAAIVSYDPRDEEAMMEVNVRGTANVVNACVELGIRRLIHLSSVAALGRNSKSTVISESAKWKESPLNTVYAKSKHLAELEVRRGEAEGLQAILLNPSIILGAGDWSSGSTRIFNYAYKGARFYPSGSVNYVDLQDVAKAVSISLSRPDLKGRYILNGGTTTYRELFTIMAEHFKSTPPAIEIPPALAKALWPLESFRSAITGKPPLITRETALLSSQHFTYENIKATKELGITFTPLKETLQRVCHQLMERYLQ